MEEKYIQIFDGYRGAYGVADWTNVKIDPVSGKKKPDYRWNFEPFTDQIFIDHLSGCLLYTSPSPRDRQKSRMPSSA